MPPDGETRLGNIAKLAPLLVFEELKRVFSKSTSGLAKRDINKLLQNLESEIQRVNPSITVGSYKSKFTEDILDPEPPYVEFFFLCFLLAEVDRVDGDVREFFQEQWEKWMKKNAAEVGEFTSDKWVKDQLERLIKSQNKRGKESTKRAGKEQ